MARRSTGSTLPISTFVFFDIEATGLPKGGHNPRITEICFLALARQELSTAEPPDYPRVLNKLSLCVNPEQMSTREALNMTGLRYDSLELLPTFRRQAPLIVDFLRNLPQPVCLVSHNGYRFDFPLLRVELERANQSIPDTVYCADTVKALVDMYGPGSKYKRYTLTAVYQRTFGRAMEAAHSAEDDCVAMLKIIKTMAQKFVAWCDENVQLFESVDPILQP